MRADIQVLRGLAVLAVILFHAAIHLPGGFAGVDVFFVISGFVITEGLLRKGPNFVLADLREFLVRRFFRLAPSLFVLIMFTSLGSLLFVEGQILHQVNRVAAGAIFGISNLVLALTSGGYFEPDTSLNPLLHTWSLSVEDQFYLAFAVSISIFCWIFRRKIPANFDRAAAIFIATMAFGSLVLMLANEFDSVTGIPKTLTGFYSPLSRAWEFLGGSLALLATRKIALTSGSKVKFLQCISLLGMLASFLFLTSDRPSPGLQSLVPVGSAMLFLVAGSYKIGFKFETKESRPLLWAGNRSYSLYLWHWPVLVFVASAVGDAPVATLVSLGVVAIFSELNYRFVETKFRIHSTDPEAGFPRVRVSVKFGVAVASCVALASIASIPISQSHPTGDRDQIMNAFRMCTDVTFNPEKCVFGAAGAKGEALLVGDSQALALAPGIVDAMSNLGLKTVLSSRSGCPFIDSDTTGEKPLNCRAWQKSVMRFIADSSPELVVIANRSSGYTNFRPLWRTFNSANGASTLQTVRNDYKTALESTARSLERLHIRSILIQNIPEPINVPRNASLLSKFLPKRVPNEFTSTTSQTRRELSASVEVSTSRLYSSMLLFDPYKSLCQNSVCKYLVNEQNVYSDPTHLSAFGSRLLSAAFGNLVKSAGVY